MAIETKNNTGGKFTPFGISPGNIKAAVRDIYFKKEEYARDRDEYMLYVVLETEPIGNGWTGFDREFGNPSAGKCTGQTGKVRVSPWNFYNGKTPSGYDVTVERDVVGFLRDLCQEVGAIDYWHSIDGKFETVSAIVQAIQKAKPFKDVFISWCVGGREYLNKKNYVAYDLNLVRPANNLKPFAADANKVVRYDSAVHIRKQKAKELPDGFETVTAAAGKTNGQNGNTSKEVPGTFTSGAQKGMSPNTSFTTEINADHAQQQAALKQPEKMPEGNGIVTSDDSSDLPFDL